MSFLLTGLLLTVLIGVPLAISGWIIVSDYAQELFEDKTGALKW